VSLIRVTCIGVLSCVRIEGNGKISRFASMVAQFMKNECRAAKKPEFSGFFAAASKQSKVSGSGGRIRTNDTPGMKACGDGVSQMSKPKPLETSGFPVRCLCVSGVHGIRVHHS